MGHLKCSPYVGAFCEQENDSYGSLWAYAWESSICTRLVVRAYNLVKYLQVRPEGYNVAS
jgi:hypothetical protein